MKTSKMTTTDKNKSENPYMQVFKDPKFKTIFLEVHKLENPIAQEGTLYDEVILFLTNVDVVIGEIRHNSTGREYNLNSKESKEFFGDTFTQLLYKILNKCCYQMSSKYINNCNHYLVSFHHVLITCRSPFCKM